MNSLNLRIIHTHDIQANWDSENLKTFIPKAGEIIVYDVDELFSYERFKIGDGVTELKNLPFTVENILQKILRVENNVVHADAGRITDYEEPIT